MLLTKWQQAQLPRIEQELRRIVERLIPLGVQRIVLFGSHARGDFHEGSDIDLFIVHDTPGRFVERIGRVLEVMDSSLTVEPLVYTPAEVDQMRARGSGLLADVEREGRVLYERRAG